MPSEPFAAHWRKIATHFLKLGFTAYGRPAIMGMQAEIRSGNARVTGDFVRSTVGRDSTGIATL
jgi:hypothetical protein